jgi:hypothetical protein
LKNSKGVAVSEFDYLDKASLSIDYKLLVEVKSISFLIVIRNDEQTAVAQVKSPEMITDVKTLGSMLSLTTTIDKIEFNPGRYTMTVSIIKGKSDDLLYVCRDTCAFVVNGDEIGYAPILMNLHWNK